MTDKERCREVSEQFCHWLRSNYLIGIDNPCSWECLRDKFPEFAAKTGVTDVDVEVLKHRYPLRFICADANRQENSLELWNEYWNSRKHDFNRIEYCRNKLCGIGSRLVKLRLNSLKDDEAFCLRRMLELEDVQITSEKYFGEYWKRNVRRGFDSAVELVEFYKNNPAVIECGASGIYKFRVAWNPRQESEEQFEWDVSDFNNALEVGRFSLPIGSYSDPQILRLEKLISAKISPK
jgi:hypothetical protein